MKKSLSRDRFTAVIKDTKLPEACAAELTSLAQNGATRFVLAHLSQQNNRPDLAYQVSRRALGAAGLLEGADYVLRVAAPADERGVMVF